MADQVTISYVAIPYENLLTLIVWPITLAAIVTVLINKFLAPSVNISSHKKQLICLNSNLTLPNSKSQRSSSPIERTTLASNSKNTADYLTITYVGVLREDLGTKIAKRLVERKLAAQVNMVRSNEVTYIWGGLFQQHNESMLIIKSHSSKVKEMTEYIEKKDPYFITEVLTIRVDTANEKYIDWVKSKISNSSPITEAGPSEMPQSQSSQPHLD